MHQLLGFLKNENKNVIFFLLKNFFVLVFKRLITYLDDNWVIHPSRVFDFENSIPDFCLFNRLISNHVIIR